MEVEVPNLSHGYPDVVNTVLRHGKRVVSRDLPTYEITPMRIIVPDAEMAIMLPVGTNRGVNTKLAAVESLQLIGESFFPDLLFKAAPKFTDVMINPGSVQHGAYGPRARSSMSAVVQKLQEDPSTRQAVISIWRPDDLHLDGDKPCTVFLQFMIRNDELDLHVYMRSNDVWLGLTYDAFMFSQLQCTVANVLRICVGMYVHNATSFHIYDRDVEGAMKLETPKFPTAVILDNYPYDGLQHDLRTPIWSDMSIAAQNLAHDVAPAELRDANPWYERQLKKIREA